MSNEVESTDSSESSEPSEVTYVGGVAVEQVEPLDSSLEYDEREAAKAAVRKAIQEAGESSVSDVKASRAKDPVRRVLKTDEDSDEVDDGTIVRGADGKFLPREVAAKTTKPSEDDTPVDITKASVKELLKAREKVANIKKNATDEISQARAAFEQERAQFAQQMQQFQVQQRELQRRAQSLQALKSDPARAIRELGMNPEEYILQLAQEGTPEGAAARKQREVDAQLAEIKAWRQEQQMAAQRAHQEAQQRAVVEFRHQAVKDFTDLGLQEEKYPHVANFFKGNEKALVSWGDLAAEEYRNLSGGKEGSYADILDYIEDQLAERSNNWYNKRQGSKQVETPKPKAAPSKSKGMSLNPGQSGERRTLAPRDLGDLDGDERLEAAKAAVAIAMAASRRE